jgi:hypothetical protein
MLRKDGEVRVLKLEYAVQQDAAIQYSFCLVVSKQKKAMNATYCMFHIHNIYGMLVTQPVFLGECKISIAVPESKISLKYTTITKAR